MNKQFKFFLTSAAIAAALVGAVSCQKDYSGDIKGLDEKIAALQTQLNDLQNKINNGEVVTSVTSTANGIEVKTNKGTYTITNGKDGKDGKDGVNGTNGTNGKDGAPGSVVTIGENGNWFIDGKDTGLAAAGKDGKDGKDGENGKDGVNGTNGKDGQNGEYYVPNPATGFFTKYTWDAAKGEYVASETTISFVAPGAITAVWDAENNQLVFKGIEGKDPYTITLLASLKSLVFLPELYIDGVEAMQFTNFTFVPKDLVKKDSKDEKQINKQVVDDPKKETTKDAATVEVIPTVVAKYHVNPANADLSFLKEGESTGLSFVVSNARKVETRATASKDFKVTPIFKSFKDGILTVEVQMTGTPASEDSLSVIALNVERADGEFVVSDYATLQKNAFSDLGIAFTNKYAKETLKVDDAHFRRASMGIGEKDEKAFINKFAAWTTGEDALKDAEATCDVQVKFNSSLDLKTLVAAHKVKEGADNLEAAPVELTPAEMEALGLTWEFAVVNKYAIGAKGSETDQANFVDLKDGVFTPKVYSTTGEAAIGRTPIIRVALKHGNDVVEYAYIKVYISDKEDTTEPFDAEYKFTDKFAFDCNKASLELMTTVEYMNVNIYNRLGFSKDAFHALYNVFDNNYIVKDEKGKEIKNIGTVEEVENTEVEGTHILKWTITVDEAWENTGKEIVHYVAYKNKENDKLKAVIKLVAPIDAFKKEFNVATTEYVKAYWNDEKTVTYYNVFTPDEKETDSAKCIFLTDINISFRTWTTGDKSKDGKQLGTLGVLKLNEDTKGAVTKIEYFFCKKDIEAVKKIGDKAVTFKVSEDGTELQATIKIDGKDVTETIAKINNEATILSTNGLNAPNSISVEKNDVSKILVNTGELFTYIGAKGYVCGDTKKAVKITFNGADHFRADIVRPVNIDAVAADYFVDALDFGEPHTFIRLEDLINPYDWRGRHFVKPYENYWEYYGIEKIEVVDDTILWDAVDGKKEAKPENVVVKADYETKTMGNKEDKTLKESKFGFLTYRNGNVKAQAFNFYVKVRVTYTWGVIETTEVAVPVHKTIGD